MAFQKLSVLAACASITLAGGAAYAYQDQSKDIVVEGARDQRVLKGGEWSINVSRAYHFGTAADPNDARPRGKDKSWRFCIKDTDVEPMIRMLVGEGRTESSATTSCTKLIAHLKDGKLDAQQLCKGGNMVMPGHSAPGTEPFPGNPANDLVTVQSKNTLNVTGHYSEAALRIDFDDRQEPMSPEPLYQMQPDVLRWSIKGQRVGDCHPEAAEQKAAPAQ